MTKEERMTKEELKQKQYDNWNRYYQKHKSEINARRKKVREDYKNKLSIAEKRIEELEKENAELKDELKSKDSIIADIDESEGYLVHENQELNEQLTKAKEIIKSLLKLWNDVMTEETVKALIVKAEQFLKEVEDV